MRRVFFFIGFLLLATLAFGQQKVQSDEYNKMLQGLLSHTVNEVSALEAAIEDGVVFLDSREKKEYDISHIKNAQFVGYNTFNMDSIKNIPKDAKIIVYCSVGARSENVAEKLIKAGYTNVYNMYGGIFEWVNQELPIYTNEGETKAVHAYDNEWGVWVTKGEKVFK